MTLRFPTRLLALALVVSACSPATIHIADALARQRIEAGEALEVDVRFCIDGPRQDESAYLELSGTVVFEVEPGDAASSAKAYVLGAGDTTDDPEDAIDAEVPATGEGIAYLSIDGDGPWESESGRRCGALRTLRVELDGAIGVWAELSVGMEVGESEGLDDESLEIELSEPRIVEDPAE